MTQGKLIVFSGGEGSGKTTMIQRLKAEYPNLVTTKEPGGTEAGARIRSILVDDGQLDLHVQTELYLFLADRAEHVAKVIQPALDKGQIVISDRYWMDTAAYQWMTTMGRADLGNFIRYFQEWHWPIPDLWVWFDIDPEVGLRRRRSSGEINRIDQRDLIFHNGVRDAFRTLFMDNLAPHQGLGFPKTRIDANQNLDTVYGAVKLALQAVVNL